MKDQFVAILKNNLTPLLEKRLFYLFVVINALPILILPYFPTFDGPAHLHNTFLLKEVLFNDNLFIKEFIDFNNSFFPNWTSHFLLTILNLIFPPFYSEKLILLVYVVFLPISFRYLLNSINKSTSHFSFLIFPFVYHYLFFLGFYNFNIALILMFLTLAFWIRNERQIGKLKNTFILFVLFWLLYFCHLFVFLTTIGALGLLIIGKVLPLSEQKIKEKDFRKNVGKDLLMVIATAIFPLIAAYVFLHSRSSFTGLIYLDFSERISYILKAKPMIGFSNDKELKFSIGLLLTLVAMMIISIKNRKESSVSGFKKSMMWLIASLAVFFLSLIAPNESGTGGYFNMRLVLLGFLFLITWLGLQFYGKKSRYVLIVLLMVITFSHNLFKWINVKRKNPYVAEIVKMSEQIKENSVVMPFYFLDDWYMQHFSNYLGISKPLIIIENYECSVDYFPLKWKNDFDVYAAYNVKEDAESIHLKWYSRDENRPKTVNYIFILGSSGEMELFNSPTAKLIRNNYILTYQSENCSLYRLNQNM